MNVHDMNNAGVEKMRNALRWLESQSKMKFKQVYDDFPVASTSLVVLNDLKTTFSVESLRKLSAMLAKMPRAEVLKSFYEIGMFVATI